LAYERDGHILEVELVRAVHLAHALREDERAEALALGEVAALVVVAHLLEEVAALVVVAHLLEETQEKTKSRR